MTTTTSTAEQFLDTDGRHVIRKVMRRLIPFMGALYFINYLDRTNIGFAKLTMSADLGLNNTMYGLASGLFFIGYLVFEVPSNLALHKFGARRWIARIMVSWGIVAGLMAFVPSHGWLYVMRVVLGVAEAGFFPGMILYLTYWFPRRERAKITALFLSAIPISSALGAPLSGAIMQWADGLFGLAGWRLMFLMEGIPAVLLGVVCWFYLTDRPADARWLTAPERRWLQGVMEQEERATDAAFHYTLKQSLTKPRILALAFVYFGIVYALYALSFFLPTIVAGFAQAFNTKYSLFQTGLIVAVPFVVGTIAMIPWARNSDRTGERVRHTALPMLVVALTIPVALYLSSPLAVMILVTLTAIGIFSALPVFWSLPSAFLTGASAAGGIAMINSLGNVSGFAAPFVTGWLTDAFGTVKAGLWLVGIVTMLAAVAVFVLGHAPEGEHAAARD
jgi:MFS family permease